MHSFVFFFLLRVLFKVLQYNCSFSLFLEFSSYICICESFLLSSSQTALNLFGTLSLVSFSKLPTSTLASFMNHFLVIFCCRIDVMSTASHIVGTRPYTALVAEVRWRQCGCCWRVELTVASRTTTMTPQWWWPRTKKWVRRWQRGKTINIMDIAVIPLIQCCSFYSVLWLYVPASCAGKQ